ncbi:GGDEF domain-containing protein [Thomasclavelia sp.]
MRILLKKSKLLINFITNFSFIFVITIIMFLHAVASLDQNISIYAIDRNMEINSVLIPLAYMICFIIILLVNHKQFINHLSTMLINDKIRFKQLVYFSYVAVIYIFIDIITLILPLNYTILSVFVIGSIFLLYFEIVAIIHHSYYLCINANIEQEYFILKKQRDKIIRNELKKHRMAYTDELTGVYTRKYIMRYLDILIEDREKFILAYIDLNNLKYVNDSYGHDEGDRYLQSICKLLSELLTGKDLLSRIGGDEFMLLFSQTSLKTAQDILEIANIKLSKMNFSYPASISYGFSKYNGEANIFKENLLQQADIAMYEQKRKCG